MWGHLFGLVILEDRESDVMIKLRLIVTKAGCEDGRRIQLAHDPVQ
jgi:hypothetical protein